MSVTLRDLADDLRASAGLAHKSDIAIVMQALDTGSAASTDTPIGDDCAAIPDGDGYLLFAIEGLLNSFVEHDPWFAGYCAMMVNLSDIAAMGGRPLALVDAVWSKGDDAVTPILAGLAEAARVYGVPIVGGHTNLRNDRSQLAAAVLGRARRLLSSFDARPGDALIAAIDLRGSYREPQAYWDASTGSPPERLRGDLALLPELAEAGLAHAAKDISMAGSVGTTLMLLECSGAGAVIDADAIPRPPASDLHRWLSAFPSFGFILASTPAHAAEVIARFAKRGIDAAIFGTVTAGSRVELEADGQRELLWDFATQDLMACGKHASCAIAS